MSMGLFLCIARAVEDHCSHIVQRRNAAGQQGHNTLKKVSVAVCLLAYGFPTDYVNDWIGMAESNCIKSLKKFVKSIIEIFREEYLRALNEEDTARVL